MIPHEKEMVERLADEPFALIGINSDRDRESLIERIEKEGITWRNIPQGSTSGPIPTKWNVRAWPTIYVVDAEGVIRYKNVRGQALDKAVDTLLAELDAEQDAPGTPEEDSEEESEQDFR